MNIENDFNTIFKVAKPRFIKFFGNKKFYSGFTLIELTVVIFLIGLIISIAMPRLGNFFFQSDLKSVARSLRATVHLLRSKSITGGKNTVLNFDLEKGSFWGTYENNDSIEESLQKESYITSPYYLPKGIRFLDAANINSPQQTFGKLSSIFNSKGVLEETILHLADRHDKILTIIINAYTGRFLLYDKYVVLEYTK